MLRIITLTHLQNPERRLRSQITPNENHVSWSFWTRGGPCPVCRVTHSTEVFMGLFCPPGFSLPDLQSGKMQPNGNLRDLSFFSLWPSHRTDCWRWGEKEMGLLWDKELSHPMTRASPAEASCKALNNPGTKCGCEICLIVSCSECLHSTINSLESAASGKGG